MIKHYNVVIDAQNIKSTKHPRLERSANTHAAIPLVVVNKEAMHYLFRDV